MEPADEEHGPAYRRAQERIARERRIAIVAQLIVNLAGIGLLIYSFVIYQELGPRLIKQFPYVKYLPIPLVFGLVYFSVRAVVVYRQLRRR